VDPVGGLKLGLLSYGMVENGAEWNADAGASRVEDSGRDHHKGYELSGGHVIQLGNLLVSILYGVFTPLNIKVCRKSNSLPQQSLTMMASPVNIKVSKGEIFQSVKAEIEALLSESGWELLDNDTIRKSFHFKTHTKVLVGFKFYGNYITLSNFSGFY
jgi:hypothetical protein